jgi:hypothetical protein
MIRNLHARSVRLLLSSIACLGLSAPALAQEAQGFAKEGGYAGVSGLLNFTFDGETFDGLGIYKEVDGEELVILPRLDKQNMIRGILGYRGSKGAFELSYEQARHGGTFLELPTRSTFQAVNIDGRFFFATRGRVQPHLLAGASIPWFTIKEGSFLDPDVGNARFRGFGVNSEAGITFYLQPRVGISAGYAYRVMWFDRVTGVSDTLFELRPRFRETSGTVVITGLFTF